METQRYAQKYDYYIYKNEINNKLTHIFYNITLLHTSQLIDFTQEK